MKNTEFYFYQQDFECIGMYSVSNAGKFCKWILMCRLWDLKIKNTHICQKIVKVSMYPLIEKYVMLMKMNVKIIN